MANIFHPLVAGSSVIPTADATHYTGLMSADYSVGQVYVEFFSDAAGTALVTPTGGIVTATGSHNNQTFMPPGNVSHIMASFAGTSPTYEPPMFQGCMTNCKITFSGITGADYARVTVWRA